MPLDLSWMLHCLAICAIPAGGLRHMPAEPASKSRKTAREFSAGGVVVRQRRGRWWMVTIEPSIRRGEHPPKPVLALPKGIIDPGERAEQTAVREVREETGVTAELVQKLGDVKYVYVRNWGDRARVFKVVSYFLLRYRSGRIGNLPAETQHEIASVKWILLEDAPRLLTYKGDREMAKKAWEAVTQG
jgi:8-oxo-dGTP pyrophosphatase MutT (NUDIX family)